MSKCLEDETCGLFTGEVLLARDEVTVADREPAPQPGLDVVGAKVLHLVLDAPRHEVLVRPMSWCAAAPTQGAPVAVTSWRGFEQWFAARGQVGSGANSLKVGAASRAPVARQESSLRSIAASSS
jgi:hypothetical protein